MMVNVLTGERISEADVLNKNISADSMIEYLQSMMDDVQEEIKNFGTKDRVVNRKIDAMIACKEMVECMIGAPVNLRKDGKVTVGF